MSKFSMKMQGKEVGPASVYAEPHDMKGRAGARMSQPQQIETLKDEICMVVGNIGMGTPPPTKTSGIKIRGTGAATKGTMARGPMA